MTSAHHIKKESGEKQEVKKNNETKVDEIILKAEEAGEKEKLQLNKEAMSGGPVNQIGEKISLVLVFILLLVSIIQSVELFNLRNQILKGQFSAVEAAAPASGGSQALPSQQGGC